MSILIVLSALSLVVAVHELGHFLVARAFGVSCPVFSVGLGPRLFGFNWRGTNFCLSLLPLGGYVKMKGMLESGSELDEDSCSAKTRWQRFLIFAAGPSINLFSAFICAAIVFSSFGIAVSTNTIDKVIIINSELKRESILQASDTIISVNGRETKNSQEVISALRAIPDNSQKNLKITRGSDQKEIVLDPGKNLSITFANQSQRLNPVDAARGSANIVTFFIGVQISFIKDALAGNAEVKANLSGPIGIVNGGIRISEQVGWLEGMARFAFVISMALGFMNLLPIPMLDGGHMAILAIEMIARRDLNLKFKKILLVIGFIMLIGLTLFVTYNDISKLI